MRRMLVRSMMAVVPLLAVVACTDAAPAGTCTGRFPADHVVNSRVDTLPTSPFSSAWINRLTATEGATMTGVGASSFIYDGSRAGIPTNTASIGPTVTLVDALYGINGTFMLPEPAVPRFEGEPNPAGAFDRHYLVTDTTLCRLVETIGFGPLTNTVAGAAVWNLRGYDAPSRVVPDAPFAEAAVLPITPLLYNYDEVAAGRIAHVLRMTASTIAPNAVWPARASDGRDTDVAAVPMGAHLRLRAGTDISALGPQARVIAQAMKEYGMILADSSHGGWYIVGSPDERWNDQDLATLKSLTLDKFEVIDPVAQQANPFAPSFRAATP